MTSPARSPSGPALRVRAGLSALLVVAGTSLVACASEAAPFTPRELAIIGDSLVVRVNCPGDEVSQECLTTPATEVGGPLAVALDGRYDTTVDAEGGRRIRQMLHRARALAEGSPDVMVENLGTNDSIVGNTGWAPPFDELLSIMLEAPCVVLTTVSVGTNELDPQRRGIASQINDAVFDAADDHDEVRVVDWDAAVREHGSAFSQDGFHPTSKAARQWFAEEYRSAADSCDE